LQAPDRTSAAPAAADWSREHELLCEAVREAGELALGMARAGVESWDKRDGTPVSEADMAVDRLLAQRLQAGLPEAGWLSEETARKPSGGNSGLVWVVDPIDGTSAFVAGTGHWCVGACLLHDGRPVIAAAYAPEQNRFYEALAGGGARLNNETMSVSSRSKLDGARAVAHASVLKHSRWRGPAPELTCAMTTSLILRQCLVATGEYDMTLAFGQKSDWDLAPGELIVREAGGQALDLSGNAFRYNQAVTRQNGLMAGPSALLDGLRERLHKAS
jgi:myo-inositol-1(or 4)-monophosphatase